MMFRHTPPSLMKLNDFPFTLSSVYAHTCPPSRLQRCFVIVGFNQRLESGLCSHTRQSVSMREREILTEAPVMDSGVFPLITL